MSQLTQINSDIDICTLLLKEPKIRFAGIINNKGRLVSGGFNTDTIPYEKDEKRQMMFMQIVLDYSMRKEFDETLGPVEFTTTRRKNVTMATFPFEDNLLLVSSEPDTEIENVVLKTKEIFKQFQFTNDEFEKKQLWQKTQNNEL